MALRDNMQQVAQAKRPPNLRAASRPTQSGASCRYFKAKIGSKGACRLYGGFPVSGNQVCDSYKAG